RGRVVSLVAEQVDPWLPGGAVQPQSVDEDDGDRGRHGGAFQRRGFCLCLLHLSGRAARSHSGNPPGSRRPHRCDPSPGSAPTRRPETAVRPASQTGYAAGVTDGDAVDWRGLNRANWDARVPVHLASELYDLGGFRAGACSLWPFEAAEAGDVTGKRLV